MAQPNLARFKSRGLLLKEEVTEGTDSVPVVATDGLMIMNGTSGTEFDKIERAIDRPFFTNNPFAVGNKRAFIEGDVEIFPPATPGITAPHADVLLRIGGMARTYDAVNKLTTYSPLTTGIVSATAYWWHVDAHKRVLGSRAAINSVRMGVGAIFMLNARILGVYTNVTKETLPTNIVLPADVPVPVTAENTVTTIREVGGASPNLVVWAKELTVSFGTALGTKEYTSKRVNAISDRLATWTLRMARADLADFNPWTVRDAGEIVELDMVQTPSGTLTQKLAIRGQIETVSEVDIDGDLGWEIGGPCIASTTGNDEFIVEFEDTAP